MRKTKFISVLVAVAMVLAMTVSAFATVKSPDGSSDYSPKHGRSGAVVTTTTDGKVTAVDENGQSLTVEAATLAKSSETMKAVTKSGSAKQFIDDNSQKLAAAVVLSTQKAKLDELQVAAAMSLKTGATAEKPATVTIPVTAAKAEGSVVVMQKTADGWTVLPATIEEGKVVATVTADGDVVVMVAPETAVGRTSEAAGKWYDVYENFAVIAEIVEEDDTRSDEVTTRGDFLNMLFAMVGKPAGAAANSFTDMEGFEEYEAAVNWAVEEGICAGYGDGTVRLDKQITREEMVKLLYYFAKYMGASLTETTDLAQFVDAGLVSDWAADAVKWANAKKIVNGTSTTTLSPKANSLRCQAFTVLYNYVVTE